MRNHLKELAKSAGRLAIGWLALPPVAAAALRERIRPRSEKPSLFFGTLPLINIKFHAEAMRRLGYAAETLVDHVYAINSAGDFDQTLEGLSERVPGLKLLPSALRHHLGHYLVFLHALRHHDVFNYYFDGLILRDTPLHHLELQLLGLAGKRSLFMPYGADVQIVERSRNLLFKHAMMRDYPEKARAGGQVAKQMNYCLRHADFVISGVDWVDSMPWWDMLVAGHFAIDTAQWSTPVVEPDPSRPVRVLHAPNHRELKGTRFLLQAIDELQSEGVPVELVRVEGVPNTEIHELMASCDVVADQFVVGWYAMFALEGMSMGKPVLTYLRDDLVDLYSRYSWAASCPIVNTPPDRIKAQLRRLVEDPELRARLGREGRAYVEAHHSLEAIGRLLDGVYKRMWGSVPAS